MVHAEVPHFQACYFCCESCVCALELLDETKELPFIKTIPPPRREKCSLRFVLNDDGLSTNPAGKDFFIADMTGAWEPTEPIKRELSSLTELA